MFTLLTFFQLVGLVLEIVGVILMANVYIVVPKRDIIQLFLSALIRGESAKGSVGEAVFSTEDKQVTLQGLALIGLGFCIQAISVLVSILVQPSSC